MNSNEKKLLTLGIPTYNRLNELEKALHHLSPQIIKFQDSIEFIVQDNHSSVDLEPIIQKYRHLGMSITFIRNNSNLGMDGNFSKLFENANGKYVWLLSDDDIVVENGIQRVIEILSNNNISSLYLSNLWFLDKIDFNKFDISNKTDIVIHNDSLSYLKEVNYWITFLSANIVNKELIKNKIHLGENVGSFLALLDWILPAIFQPLPNIVMRTPILACSAKNQGGYKFVEVFAVNFNKILDSFIEKGYSSKIKEIINSAMIKNYFPNFILSKKSEQLNEVSSYKKENWLIAFFKVYKYNYDFYVYMLPMFFLKGRYLYKWNLFLHKKAGKN